MLLRLGILVGIIVLLAAGYFSYSYSKDKVIAEMIAATERQELDNFAARVDWDALRSFLKQDLVERKNQPNPYNLPTGPDASKIDSIVDYYVQPANIDILFYYHEEVFSDVPLADFIDSTGFVPPFGFYVTVAYPKNLAQGNNIVAATRDRMKVRADFLLDGTTFKIKKLHVPLFMVPPHVYSTPAVNVFGRPKNP